MSSRSIVITILSLETQTFIVDMKSVIRKLDYFCLLLKLAKKNWIKHITEILINIMKLLLQVIVK